MNIDFIKWMVGYADGFEMDLEFDCEVVKLPNDNQSSFGYLKMDKTWRTINYPLLLQRAIEGVNREYAEGYKDLRIEPCGAYQYEVYDKDNLIDGWTFDNIDEAKVEALKYIYNNKE